MNKQDLSLLELLDALERMRPDERLTEVVARQRREKGEAIQRMLAHILARAQTMLDNSNTLLADVRALSDALAASLPSPPKHND